MNAATSACALPGVTWDGINWAELQDRVRRLQARIVKATQMGRHNKVKALQWLLTDYIPARRTGDAVYATATMVERWQRLMQVLTQVRAAFRLLRRVSSPHLPVVHELLTDPAGDLWLVTGLVEGEPLGPGPVSVPRALTEAAALAHALQAIHDAGTHHGDLSPKDADNEPLPMFGRVKVCAGSEATSRGGLCARYPSGNYKPIGQIQKKSDGIKISVFGYLADDSNTRYGGVLRAPMGYVGPTKPNAAGVGMIANIEKEWNQSTGVFVENPRNGPYAYSGVINYVNRFGSGRQLCGQGRWISCLHQLDGSH